jgi:hypothetical protein
MDEDEVIANIMGKKNSESLSEVQQQYKEKIKAQIAKAWTSWSNFTICDRFHIEEVARMYHHSGGRLSPTVSCVQKAAELEAKAEAGKEEFEFGVALYERGRYADSESMLRTALDVAGMILCCSYAAMDREIRRIYRNIDNFLGL